MAKLQQKRKSRLRTLAWCLAPAVLVNVLWTMSLAAKQMMGTVGPTPEALTAPSVEGLALEEKGWSETAREAKVAWEGVALESAEEEAEWLKIFRVSGVHQKLRFQEFARKQKRRSERKRRATHSEAAEGTPLSPPTAKETDIEPKGKQEGQVDRQQLVTASAAVKMAKQSAPAVEEAGAVPQKRMPPATAKTTAAAKTATRSAPAAGQIAAKQKKHPPGRTDVQEPVTSPATEKTTTAQSAPAVKDAAARKKPDELKLPTPIFVTGMMKAGTTSIYSYFKCGMDLSVTKLSHYDCRPAMSCGRRMYSNVAGKRHIFDNIPSFHLYAEIDGNSGKGVHLPQYKYLQELYAAHPNTTWILNLRDPHKWLNSVDRWQGLRQRFINSNLEPDLPWQGSSKPGQRPTGEKDEDMLNFYDKQAERVRDFARNHPSIHLVEVHIDKPEAGQILEDAFGISRRCWGNKNANKGNGTSVWTEQ